MILGHRELGKLAKRLEELPVLVHVPVVAMPVAVHQRSQILASGGTSGSRMDREVQKHPLSVSGWGRAESARSRQYRMTTSSRAPRTCRTLRHTGAAAPFLSRAPGV